MSNVHRLRTSDRVFFIPTNLNQGERPLQDGEYEIILETIAESRKRLGFLFCGYVLMPDHWHALISTQFPLTISKALQDIKRVSSLKINRLHRPKGPGGSISSGIVLCAIPKSSPKGWNICTTTQCVRGWWNILSNGAGRAPIIFHWTRLRLQVAQFRLTTFNCRTTTAVNGRKW